MLLTLLKNEWQHYKILPDKARRLILSFNLWSIAQPILSLFLNAYIWRTTVSVVAVAMYNLGFVIALPFGFFVNGKLLKKFHVTQTYFFGLFLSMLGAVSVVFFHSSVWYHLLSYGLVYGFGAGIYWASRNYLTFSQTNTEVRNYFFSIVSMAGSVIDIVVSFSIGWIIAFADISHLYTPFLAYACITIFALVSIFFAGTILLNSGFNTPVIDKIWQPFISRRWNLVRIANVAIGVWGGMSSLVSTLLILHFLGKEGILGTIGAVVSAFTICLYYLYGRLAKQHHRGSVLLTALLATVPLGILLILSKGTLPVLIYVLLAGLPISFYSLTFDPWLLDVMDKELSNHHHEKYFLIFDCEVFLNIGRAIGLAVFIFLALKFSGEFALKLSPLLLSVLQIIIFASIWKKIKWDGN